MINPFFYVLQFKYVIVIAGRIIAPANAIKNEFIWAEYAPMGVYTNEIPKFDNKINKIKRFICMRPIHAINIDASAKTGTALDIIIIQSSYLFWSFSSSLKFQIHQ